MNTEGEPGATRWTTSSACRIRSSFMSDERRDLEILALSISIDVQRAVQAALVTTAARVPFHARKEDFFTNPANTFIYAALQALEERSIVAISETIKEQTSAFPLPTPLRRRLDLVAHRHTLSHPAKVKWSQAWVQEFYDDDRQHLDVRAALVWDLQRSVNERLRELGAAPQVETILVHPGMAIALRDILRTSMKRESQATLPTEADLLDVLTGFRDRYLEFLLRCPDGQPPGAADYIAEKRAQRGTPPEPSEL
jgi:hypothetical protein